MKKLLACIGLRTGTKQSPEGWWLCTRAEGTFAEGPDGFKPGRSYPCRAFEGGSGYRIAAHPRAIWTPYWDGRLGRFCYPPEKLDFRFLGMKPTREQMASERVMDVHDAIAIARAEAGAEGHAAGRTEALKEAAHICGILAKGNEKGAEGLARSPVRRRKRLARAAAMRACEWAILGHAGRRPWTLRAEDTDTKPGR